MATNHNATDENLYLVKVSNLRRYGFYLLGGTAVSLSVVAAGTIIFMIAHPEFHLFAWLANVFATHGGLAGEVASLIAGSIVIALLGAGAGWCAAKLRNPAIPTHEDKYLLPYVDTGLLRHWKFMLAGLALPVSLIATAAFLYKFDALTYYNIASSMASFFVPVGGLFFSTI